MALPGHPGPSCSGGPVRGLQRVARQHVQQRPLPSTRRRHPGRLRPSAPPPACSKKFVFMCGCVGAWNGCGVLGVRWGVVCIHTRVDAHRLVEPVGHTALHQLLRRGPAAPSAKTDHRVACPSPSLSFPVSNLSRGLVLNKPQDGSKKKVLSLPCLYTMAKMPSCGFGLKPCVTSQLCNSVFQDFGALAVPYRLFRRRAH